MELACDNKMDVICQYISLFTCICNQCMCVNMLGEFENELERKAFKIILLPCVKKYRGSDWHHANYVFAMLLDFEFHPMRHNKTES